MVKKEPAKKKTRAKKVPSKPRKRTKVHKSASRVSRMRIAAEMMIAGWEHKKIMEEFGICNTTLHKWKKDPAFIALTDELQEEALEHARKRIASLTKDALDSIQETLRCDHYPSRMKAAEIILSRVRGLEAGHRVEATMEGSMRVVNQVFEGKSVEELEFYAKWGMFPEDVPPGHEAEEEKP